MVFLSHNHPMSYIFLMMCWANVTAISVNCESEISQHSNFCPSKANPSLLYSSTLVYINHHLQGLRVLINSRRQYHTNISLSNSKTKAIQKSLQTFMHMSLGYTCDINFLSWKANLAFCVDCVAII